MKLFTILLLTLTTLYFGSIIYLYITQDNKIFNKKYAKPYTPKVAKKIYFKTSDGLKLEGAFTNNGDNLPTNAVKSSVLTVGI